MQAPRCSQRSDCPLLRRGAKRTDGAVVRDVLRHEKALHLGVVEDVRVVNEVLCHGVFERALICCTVCDSLHYVRQNIQIFEADLCFAASERRDPAHATEHCNGSHRV